MSAQTYKRFDGRSPEQLRHIEIIPHFQSYAEGSVLLKCGNTQVICSCSVEERVPPHRVGKGGWLTAEYAMLPRATHTRSTREVTRGKVDGRTQEIQRLIGRSLRAIIDLSKLGERQLSLDCDVIQADGGTRTAAITGSYIAMVLAIDTLQRQGILKNNPVQTGIAAVSVGVVKGVPLLDLCYEEDSTAEVDFNVVMTTGGNFVELQGTAEGKPFSRQMTNDLLDLASTGINTLLKLQNEAISEARRLRS